MKKNFMLLVAMFVAIYPVFAQQGNQKHKATLKYIHALEQKQNSSDPTIKLDSVVTYKNITYQTTNPWVSPTKEVYEYDTDSRLIQITEKTWHRSKKVYGITGIKMFFYNPDGLVDSVYYNTNLLTTRFSNKFIYDLNGRLTTAYRYIFSKMDSKTEYSYNNAGLITEITCFSSFYNNEFYQKSIVRFTYNNFNQLIEEKWIAPGGVSDLILFEWDSEGNLVSQINKDFVYNWQSKTEHLYNDFGDRIKTSYFGDSESGWEFSGFEEYDYCDLNSSDLLETQIPPSNIYEATKHFSVFKSNKLFTEIKQFFGNELTEKSTYYYSPIDQEVILGVENLNYQNFNVYPNPARYKITFGWGLKDKTLQMKLFQLTGACIIDREISSEESINIETLAPGIYVYKLLDQSQLLHSGKLVKK